jgi:hypothetical protein
VSLEKTGKENNRLYSRLDKYPVNETLPGHFESEYPKLIEFLEKYYRHSHETGPAQYLKELDYKRDFVAAQDDLLRFFSQELLLGRDYFDRFVDKQTAIQTSNLLYRSKGTKYSIQQFFRVFFGFDVDIRYGRDEVFILGDPLKEELVYRSEMRSGVLFPGSRLRFKFDDGDTRVQAVAQRPRETLKYGLYVDTFSGSNPYAVDQDDYVEPFTRQLEYNVYYDLRQEVDYTIDYDDKSVVLQPIPVGYEPVVNDPWLNELAATGVMPEGQSTKITTNRYTPAHSAVGPEVTNKRITNNGFWQMFSLAIRTPISISQWKEAYKDFVHPAGMYLEGETLIQSSVNVIGAQPSVILEEYNVPAFSEDAILASMQASVTELNIVRNDTTKRVGYTQSGFVTSGRAPQNILSGFDSGTQFYTEDRLDSDRPDEVKRSRINDIRRLPFTLQELDTQYQRMSHIDDIEARRLDNVEADFSNTINTLDENQWYGLSDVFCLDSDRTPQTILGSLLDFPREYAGCPGYIFNLFGLQKPLRGYSSTEGTPQGNNFNLVTGDAQQKYSAYRDQRVWATTLDPGNSKPGQPFNYSDNNSGGTSVWDSELDYANPFEYAVIQGVAKTMRTYYLNRDPVTGLATGYIDLSPGRPAPGDSADYMVAHIRVDSAGGTGYEFAHLDSGFDSIGDHFP